METISHRLDVFDAETDPLLGFYGERGLLVEVNGEQPVEQVFSDIVTAVDRRRVAHPYRSDPGDASSPLKGAV